MNEINDVPLVLLKTSRGRIINLLQIESLAQPTETNLRQPYGCFMSSGVFHILNEDEFNLILEKYSELVKI